MKREKDFLGSQRKKCMRLYFLWGVNVVVAAAIATTDQLPAAPITTAASTPSRLIASNSVPIDTLLAHCCHAHPLPPYDSYCCHSGDAVYMAPTVYAAPGYRYGAPSVRAQSRRVARRSGRRVSRRR
jgi:hypothetical protein